VVIGGLMQDRIADKQAKTPQLGDLPLIGALFKHQQETTLKSELVILLRPIVVDSDRRWAEAVENSSRGVERLRSELDAWKARRTVPFGHR